jgi:hypothetical protein
MDDIFASSFGVRIESVNALTEETLRFGFSAHPRD